MECVYRSLEFFPHWRTNKEFTLFLVVHGMPVLFVIFLGPLATTLAPHTRIAIQYTVFPLSYAHNDYFTSAKAASAMPSLVFSL